jgi:hypothetical protein
VQTFTSLVQIASALDALPDRERGSFMRQQAAEAGCSVSTLYRRLETVGWSSGRKTRNDYGMRRLTDYEVMVLAGIKREGKRANGKQLVGTNMAVFLARQAGLEVQVTRATVDRSLRAAGMAAKRLSAPAPAVEQRSLHPNHVMAVDPSLCVLYHMDGRQYIANESEWNRNKLENYIKVKTKVWRYVAADHFSNTLWVRYYQVDGERMDTLFDFLMWCWAKTAGRTPHGLPSILMMDAGSANKAHAIANLCRALNVNLIINEPGNPRAKGCVEKAQDLWERVFESLLRFQPVANVAEMNARGLEWQELFNANLLPGGLDTRLKRPGMAVPRARIDLWLTISASQLIEAPARPICEWLLQGGSQERTLDNRRRISYRHPRSDKPTIYDLREIGGLHTKDRVRIIPLVLSDHREILVRTVDYKGVETFHPVMPIADFNALVGFRDSSPIIGHEYKAQPKSDVAHALDAMDVAAYGVDEDGVVRDAEAIAKAKKDRATPFAHLNGGTGLRPFDAVGEVTPRTNLSKSGTPAEVSLPQISTIQSRLEAQQRRDEGRAMGVPATYDATPVHVYSVIEAAQKMRERLGEVWGGEHYARLVAAFPEGVKETEFEDAFHAVKRAATFKVVGGAA